MVNTMASGGDCEMPRKMMSSDSRYFCFFSQFTNASRDG